MKIPTLTARTARLPHMAPLHPAIKGSMNVRERIERELIGFLVPPNAYFVFRYPTFGPETVKTSTRAQGAGLRGSADAVEPCGTFLAGRK